MLKTLLKHEIKSSWLEITIVNGSVLVLSILVALFIAYLPSSTFTVVTLSSLFLLFFLQAVLVILNVIRSLNKKMFSNEGYLTFSLPVTTKQLLISKILVNLLWVIFTTVIVLISIIMIIVATFEGSPFAFIIDIKEFFGKSFVPLILLAITYIISYLLFLLIIIFVLALTNTTKIRKKKVLLGISLFYLMTIIISIMNNLIHVIPYAVFLNNGVISVAKIDFNDFYMLIPSLTMRETVIMNFNALLIDIICIIGLFFTSSSLIANRLELE